MDSSSSGSTKHDQSATDQQILDLVKKMTSKIRVMDKIVYGLRRTTLRNRGKEGEGHEIIDESTVSDVEELCSDYMLHKYTFFRLSNEYFTFSDQGENLGLKQEANSDVKIVLGMKLKLQMLEDEAEVLKCKSIALFFEIEGSDSDLESMILEGSLAPTGTAEIEPAMQSNEMLSTGLFPSGENSVYGSRNFEHCQDWSPRLLSKKLRIIKFFYLRQSATEESHFSSSSSINSDLQNKFGWLRSTIDCDNFDDHSDNSELQSSDIYEMQRKIRGLVRERRKEKAKAREEGKRSLLEYMIRDRGIGEFTTLNLMHKKARELGDLLLKCIGEMFYVAMETSEARHKVSDHLGKVLKWLDEKEKTPVIMRVVSVLRGTEVDLYLRGKVQLFPPLSKVKVRASSAQQEAIDRILEGFVREILRLESVLSYPNLSEEFLSTTNVELKTFEKSLEECEKVVDQIGKEMIYLKVIHCFVSENLEESLIMKAFEEAVAEMVGQAWGELDQGYIPS